MSQFGFDVYITYCISITVIFISGDWLNLRRIFVRLLKWSYLSVHGNWSQWSDWGECDVTCGPGGKTRSRNCSEPYPSGGGDNCTGEGQEMVDCNRQLCQGRGEKSHCLITLRLIDKSSFKVITNCIF